MIRPGFFLRWGSGAGDGIAAEENRIAVAENLVVVIVKIALQLRRMEL